jgi:hypothetical protein
VMWWAIFTVIALAIIVAQDADNDPGCPPE